MVTYRDTVQFNVEGYIEGYSTVERGGINTGIQYSLTRRDTYRDTVQFNVKGYIQGYSTV